jgi:uncharacterized protein YecE (DUF72 family)
MIRVGCSGWSYEHWRDAFYDALPSSRWLEHYAEVFDTVEVNATFYRLPKPSTVEGWVERTPEGFCFAFKASRYLTHVRRLRDLSDGIARLVALLEPLSTAGKLGPMLWQLPPNFGRDDERLADALAKLPAGRHAFEFRNETWFVAEIYALLGEHRVALVVADRARLAPAPWVDTAGWWYLRLHHGRAGRRGNYSERELHDWAERIESVDGDVYAYFNNDWEGFAIENALTLRAELAAGTGNR